MIQYKKCRFGPTVVTQFSGNLPLCSVTVQTVRKPVGVFLNTHRQLGNLWVFFKHPQTVRKPVGVFLNTHRQLGNLRVFF